METEKYFSEMEFVDSELIRRFEIEFQRYRAAIKEINTKFEVLDEEFQLNNAYNPIHHIESRLKSLKSIRKKLERIDKPFSPSSMVANLKDVAGVRVICKYIDDVDRIADTLIMQDDIELIVKKDYIKNPKPNGYRSLHMIVSVPIFLSAGAKDTFVEIQIRTIAMDMWASLEHHLHYKSENAATPELLERLQECARTMNDVDLEMQGIYNEITGITQ